MLLNLTDQAAIAAQIQTRLAVLQDRIAERLPIWNKLSDKQKRAWVKSGKDPIMSLAWTTFKYLRDNVFPKEDMDNG
jgi:hypothetical protein